MRAISRLEPNGSACGPVIVPVFKTGGWQALLSPVGSTPTRFRHLFSYAYVGTVLVSVLEKALDLEASHTLRILPL